MDSKSESEYKKTTGYCYSEQGHNYQLTYSANAAKNSSPVIFLYSDSVWFAFKKYSSIEDKGLKVFTDSGFFPIKGVFIYAFGHKINYPLYKNYIQDALLERNYTLGSIYEPDLAPGIFDYLKNKCLSFHNSFSLENRIASGLTILSLTESTKIDPSSGALIYPNGRISYGPVFREGQIQEEELIEVLSKIANKKITAQDIDFFDGKLVLPFIKSGGLEKLMGWEAYTIDLTNRKILKL